VIDGIKFLRIVIKKFPLISLSYVRNLFSVAYSYMHYLYDDLL